MAVAWLLLRLLSNLRPLLRRMLRLWCGCVTTLAVVAIAAAVAAVVLNC